MKRLILTLGSVLLIATSVSANSETPTLGTKDSKSNTGTVTSIENMYYWGGWRVTMGKLQVMQIL
ncbi:hypothetical protein [Oceanihabitans sediminis]|uniref:hypothetical protein n=1 Tax=Oceanihabitans sediminis TaxID=1812012 RepID=UPI003A9531DB